MQKEITVDAIEALKSLRATIESNRGEALKEVDKRRLALDQAESVVRGHDKHLAYIDALMPLAAGGVVAPTPPKDASEKVKRATAKDIEVFDTGVIFAINDFGKTARQRDIIPALKAGGYLDEVDPESYGKKIGQAIKRLVNRGWLVPHPENKTKYNAAYLLSDWLVKGKVLPEREPTLFTP